MEVEGDPITRNRIKMMAGVHNPLDETEERIMSTMDPYKNTDVQADSGTSIFQSSKKNFEKIYNQLQSGFGSIQDSTIHEEIQKYGGNNKQMGAESHRESTASVRKENTKMGNL